MMLGRIECALIISPHGDDESLAVGGTIARLVDEGSRVHVLFLSIDASNHFGYSGITNVEDRRQEIVEASKILGFSYNIAFENQGLLEKLDTLPLRTLVDMFEGEINKHKPDLLLLPSGADYDQDHVACYNAGLAAARPIPMALGKHLVPRVLAYESPKLTWAQQPFKPALYVDIGDRIDLKIKALCAYRTQYRERPHVRSIENVRALATLRGADIGCDYAEAFEVLRWIV